MIVNFKIKKITEFTCEFKLFLVIVKCVTFPKLNIPLILSKTWLLLLFITGCTTGTTALTSVDTAQKIDQGRRRRPWVAFKPVEGISMMVKGEEKFTHA